MAEIESAPMHSSYQPGQDFKLDTMDLVVAVLLGVIQAVIEIVGLLGFLERTVWATGPVGFAIYAFYNGTTWILFYAGVYLRKRAMIVILAVGVTALVRWFAGDPDGPVLMFYGLFPAAFGAATIVLMRWRGGRLLFALAVAVTAVANQCAMFIGQGVLLRHAADHDSFGARAECSSCKVATQPVPVISAPVVVAVENSEPERLPSLPQAQLIRRTLPAYSERGPPLSTRS